MPHVSAEHDFSLYPQETNRTHTHTHKHTHHLKMLYQCSSSLMPPVSEEHTHTHTHTHTPEHDFFLYPHLDYENKRDPQQRRPMMPRDPGVLNVCSRDRMCSSC
jgi:hypothetical protein